MPSSRCTRIAEGSEGGKPAHEHKVITSLDYGIGRPLVVVGEVGPVRWFVGVGWEPAANPRPYLVVQLDRRHGHETPAVERVVRAASQLIIDSDHVTVPPPSCQP